MTITLYILLTLVFYILCKTQNKLLGLVLVFTGANVLLTEAFFRFGIDYRLSTNLYIIIHNLLWIIIINTSRANKSKTLIAPLLYLLFCVLVMIWQKSLTSFNNYLFIFGALQYVITFLVISFRNLKQENLAYFQSNNFILLFSPVLFFLGMSCLFGFKSRDLNNVIIAYGISLYTLINCFVNLVYYSLINVYIYKEKKRQK